MSADNPLSPEREAYLRLRQERLTRIGASLGTAGATMLAQHWNCTCPGCQLDVLLIATKWACEGEDVRQVLPLLDDQIRDLLDLRREMKRQLAFHLAAEELGLGDTPMGQA